jgi:hypothetical protein
MPRVTFVGKRALVRVHGNGTTPEHALLRFGSIFEVDTFGRKVLIHAVPALSALTPVMTSGVRTAGQASYTWVKLRYAMPQLGLDTTPRACAAAAQASIAQEQAARLAAAQMAQRAQMEAMQASGAVSGAAGAGMPAGAGMAPGMGAGYGAALPAAQLPPGYSALQGGMGMPAPVAAAPTNPFTLPQSPVYGAVSNTLYGRRRRSLRSSVAAADAPAATAPSRKEARRSLQQMYAYAPAPSSRPTYANWAPAATSGSIPVAGYGGALPGAAAAYAQQPAAATGVAYDPAAEGYLTLTFFTGFANATSFPYGKGNSVSVPGKGLKWSLEAVNWPFCSFDHTLAFELAVSTTRQGTAMGQWMVGSEDALPADLAHAQHAAGRGGPPAPAMVEAFTAPHATRRRQLKQAGLGAFLNYMEDEEVGGGKGKGKGGKGALLGYGTTRTAKLLINDTAAVELGFPTYAFESPIGARPVNVSILLDSKLTATAPGAPSAPAVFTFGLPYFQSLYYDPTVSFGDNTGMPIADLSQLPAGCADANCGASAVAQGAIVKRGERSAKNGGGGSVVASSVVGAAATAAAAALVAMMMAA